MKNADKIRNLLRIYYEGKTTLSEEKLLIDFFSNSEDLGEFEMHRAEFRYLLTIKKQQTNRDFSSENISNMSTKRNKRNSFQLNFTYIQVAASIVIFIIAFGLGRITGDSPNFNLKEVSSLKKEIQSLRYSTIVSLINQPYASSRIQAIQMIRDLDDQSNDELLVLLEKSLNEDANANVRLASINTLLNFENTLLSQKMFLKSLKNQSSPIVQMSLLQAIKNHEYQNQETYKVLNSFLIQKKLDDEIRNQVETIIKSI